MADDKNVDVMEKDARDPSKGDDGQFSLFCPFSLHGAHLSRDLSSRQYLTPHRLTISQSKRIPSMKSCRLPALAWGRMTRPSPS